MGYAVYEDRDARDRGVERWAGYGVPGVCDIPGCDESLPLGRGMGSKCEAGCGMYFCGQHLGASCTHDGILPKPDTSEWVNHILTDETWEEWRMENPRLVAALTAGQGEQS